MNVVARFFEWLWTFISQASEGINWLLTRIEVPEWAWQFGYVFTPMHFFNLFLDQFAFTPIELIGITGLISYFTLALVKWVVS